jgi:tetratricopeptide (TPR) repeat protein
MIIVALLVAFSFEVLAQPSSNQRLHDVILQGIDLTLKQDYPAAKAVFQSAIEKYPDHPAGYLYLAGTVQAEFSDYEDGFDRRLFDSLLAKGEALADQLIERKDSADWGYYYAGTALSYRAFSESERGNWPSVIIDGMNSAKMFERCLELNPKFYDAMSGLGTYYYWRSKKTEFLSWLPFVTDRKKEGISFLASAVENGTYDTFEAMNSLILVLTEEARYDEALPITLRALARYPENRSFLWCLVGIVERVPQKDTIAIKSAVTRLLASVMNATVRNHYYEAACRLKLAQFAMAEHEYGRVIEECTTILQYKDLEGKTKRDIGKKLSAAKELLSKAKLLTSQH